MNGAAEGDGADKSNGLTDLPAASEDVTIAPNDKQLFIKTVAPNVSRRDLEEVRLTSRFQRVIAPDTRSRSSLCCAALRQVCWLRLSRTERTNAVKRLASIWMGSLQICGRSGGGP